MTANTPGSYCVIKGSLALKDEVPSSKSLLNYQTYSPWSWPWIFPLSAWPGPERGLPELTSGSQGPGHTPWKMNNVTSSTQGRLLWRTNVIRTMITLFTYKGSQNCASIFSFFDAIYTHKIIAHIPVTSGYLTAMIKILIVDPMTWFFKEYLNSAQWKIPRDLEGKA